MSDDFYSWKLHPITQVIMAEFSARIRGATEELVESAGADPLNDARRSALIKAYRDLVHITLSDIDEESHGN